MKNVLIIGAVVILILLGVYFFMQSDDMMNDDAMNDDIASQDDDALTDTNDDMNNDSNEVSSSVVLAENETGNFANIASVTLSDPGFVAIYKVNSNGDTSLLGNTDLLSAGTHSDISVQLGTVVAKEETIVAVLHADDGDGEFTFPESDFYLGNETSAVVSDVDVVDVDYVDEAETLQAQVEAYIEASMDEMNDENEPVSQ